MSQRKREESRIRERHHMKNESMTKQREKYGMDRVGETEKYKQKQKFQRTKASI